MTRNEKIIIIVLLLIIMVFGMLIIQHTVFNSPSDNSQIRQTLANNSDDPGTVEVIRNIGNPNGERIAYVVGVHPLEHLTHETLVKLLPNRTDLKNCYDIYIINVTEGVGHYGDGLDNYENPGRQNGQNLAYKYVYPEILNGNYSMAIDVHSNIGAYPYKTFVFSPAKDGLGVDYAREVADNCPNIDDYAPDTTTSGPFLTEPLNNNGVPAFYFEEYSFAPQDVKDSHMMELIDAIDNLDI
ncbi:MAG: hypothetical protein ILA26_09520 [Methanobrevibacter sp.]|uniref:hypothetical protein n=1 Tax=Methanobrevibacter sp. TaxID=66852 RepID=UPI001B4C7D25|nr:hypothetical protein [Methanobrevibacter sp.]MBP3792250.1 hypothetical protein [Methanobrevibacter sp.]